MKKILAALLVLALIAPAMADVAITSSFDNTSKNLTISFDPTVGAVVRGIAVTVTVTGADVDAYVSSSFNTFMDFASVTTGYTVGMTGQHPLALETTAGVATLPITSGTPFAVSVGYLDEDDPKQQDGLTTAGTVAVLHLANINSAGGTVTVTANAARGGAVVGETIGAVTVSGTTIPAQVVNYTLAMSAGAGGTVTDNSGSYAAGSVVTLHAVANGGYQFNGWTPTTNIANPALADTTITMNANATIVANFGLLPETVSAAATPTGTTPGYITLSYTYTTTGGSVSSYGHTPIQYRFNFGDGTFSTWGTALTATKVWTTGGTKTITVEARCSIDTAVTSTSAPLSVLIQECQFYNLTKKVTTFAPVDTTNVVNSSDVSKIIAYINTYKVSTSSWVVSPTSPNYMAGFNLSTASAAINSSDLSALIAYINANKLSTSSWLVNCATKP